jgi:hypothetical protein
MIVRKKQLNGDKIEEVKTKERPVNDDVRRKLGEKFRIKPKIKG